MSPFALMDDPRLGHTLTFENPARMFVARTAQEVLPALAAMEEAHAAGLHLAGYFAYETGYLFEPRLAEIAPEPAGPWLCFGAFDAPRRFDWDTVPAHAPRLALVPGWSLQEYTARFERVIDYIRAGDIYQANLTFPLHGHVSGDALSFYAGLRARQPGRRGAFVALGEETLLSLSPELFFEIEGDRIRARPMKGTAPRGRDALEDAAHAAALAGSEKERAENLMIVDLLRNDLGRLAQIGSVEVSDLFTIEPYPTLFQMTSGIEAKLRPGLSLRDILAGLFPCGSVTGAPKIRAMQIIRELETTPRGAYCGAIGHIAPSHGEGWPGDMHFNVAIRTAILRQDGAFTLNVGSGVVFESQAEAEYAECLLKAQFLTGQRPVSG
jgi:para-aminobenzoate synthetase component I